MHFNIKYAKWVELLISPCGGGYYNKLKTQRTIATYSSRERLEDKCHNGYYK